MKKKLENGNCNTTKAQNEVKYQLMNLIWKKANEKRLYNKQKINIYER